MILIEECWKALTSANIVDLHPLPLQDGAQVFRRGGRRHAGGRRYHLLADCQGVDHQQCRLQDPPRSAQVHEQVRPDPDVARLSEKERAQILSINQANDPRRTYKEVWIGLGGVQSAVYATEVSTEEYLCYTTEEREKMEVMARAEKLGGDIQAAIRALAASGKTKNSRP